MFEYKNDECGLYYYSFIEKLSNNQTLEIIFYSMYEDTDFWVNLYIYSKRKTKHHDIENMKVTGKVGLESLLLAKTVIELFIEYIKEEYSTNKDRQINIQWSDNRRRTVYYRGLKSLGFNYVYKDGAKILQKLIHKI